MTLPEGRREGAEAASGEELRSASSGVVVSPLASSLPGRGPEGPAPWETTFAAGDVVGERYRVVRFLAAGGMGEVYEVFDEKLHTTVALKTLRWERLGDAHAEERLRREIAFSHRITHPNVARVFDVGYHRAPGHAGVDRPLMFLTMELLRGETLSDRIAREGPLALDVMRVITRGIADALEAAHAERIVHRDLKGSNVMLVPVDSGSPRAVVTDFGLARTLESTDGSTVGGPAPSVSKDARFIGSPGYMAPEQVSGQPVTPRTDIYALGVVLYEMATGHLPFRGDNVLATATMRLTHAPVPPRTYAPELPEAWERVILTCLEREPSRRYGRAREVVAALDEATAKNDGAVPPSPRGAAAPLPLPAERVPSPVRRNARRPIWALGGTLLVGLVAAGAVVAARRDAASFGAALEGGSRSTAAASPSASAAGSASLAGGAPREEAPVVVRPSVGVVGFRHLGAAAQDAWLGSALAEMLRSEIEASPGVRVVSGDAMASALRDLGVTLQGEPSREGLARVGAQVGATYTMHGSYLAVGAGAQRRLRVDISVYRTGESERVASVSEVGTDASLFDMVSRAAVVLRASLRIDEPPARALSAARAALPVDAAAARAYLEGLDCLHREDMTGARRALARAAQLEPTFGPAHLALSEANESLGFMTLAREHAKKVASLSASASREQQLSLTARRAKLESNHAAARAAYADLYADYPDSVDYGLAYARALMDNRETGKAREVLDRLASLSPLLAADPRIPLLQSDLARLAGDQRQRGAHAERALERARKLGARALEARALGTLAMAKTYFEPPVAWTLFDEAERLYLELGLRARAARLLLERAGAYANRGEVGLSARDLERARELTRGLDAPNLTSYLVRGTILRHTNGDARAVFVACVEHMARVGIALTELTCRRNIALEDRDRGRLTEARREFEASAEIARRIHNELEEAFSRDDSAIAWFKLGHPEEAIRIHQELRPLFARIAGLADEAINIQHLGSELLAFGRLDDARVALNEALEKAERGGDVEAQAYTGQYIASLDAMTVGVDAARSRLRVALEKTVQAQMDDVAYALKLNLLELDLEEGHARSDELRALDTGGDPQLAADLAWSLALEGRYADVEKHVTRAQRSLGSTESLPERIAVLRRIAEARLAAGRPRDALTPARLASELAGRGRFIVDGLQMEHVILRAERLSGHGEVYAARAADLEARARASGLVTLSRRIASDGAQGR